MQNDIGKRALPEKYLVLVEKNVVCAMQRRLSEFAAA
ncbi:hypothetical protein J2W52_004651 [Rhizobium miluonense]|uniref:Uncharacterized protein n=1 Tax=Rhizobium miluonense TaxID=411945 RepID=A0ABU1SVL3_9HYPH|nr:hypothetical protein [Rhizobium miluonense]